MTKITAQISPLFHREAEHIKVKIPNQADAKNLIRSIKGRKWSKTYGCWYVPKTREAYRQLKELFEVVVEETVIPKEEIEKPLNSIPKKNNQNSEGFRIIVLPEHDFRVKVIVPWQRKDWVEQIKSLPNRAWNKEEKYWSVPKTEEVLELLKFKFGKKNLTIDESIQWKNNLQKHENPYESEKTKKALQEFLEKTKLIHISQKIAPKRENALKIISSKIDKNLFQIFKKEGEEIKLFTGDKVFIEIENAEWLRVFVPYDKKGWIEMMRNVNGRKWNSDLKCWVIPNVKESYRFLRDFIQMKNLEFTFKISAEIPESYELPIKIASLSSKQKTKTIDKLNDVQKGEIQKLEERLILERRSIWTIKAYKNHLVGLFYFYPKLNPEDITKNQLSQYLLHLIRFKKISESTQNQIINAVKAYWERVLGRGKEWIDIPRPKKPKKMPNVLSTEEVVKIINTPKNLKHKLVLLLIYSAGMRRSELLNLLKRDINIKRRAIHIKAGKGKKDRYVALAETVVPYLEEYLKQYKPVRWLFEGQYGGKYSSTSLQKIFNKALEKSKVNPYATLHTLRHSYATHCIENGHHIKQVQEALGHNSIKTTEIYLHISSDALKKLQSPLDNLKLK